MSAPKKELNYIEVFSMLFLVGVVVGVLLPGWSTVSETKSQAANLQACRDNLTTLGKAVEDYEKKNKGRLPERLSQLTEGKNPPFAELPRCPAAPGKGCNYEVPAYEFRNGAVPRFTIHCGGANHNELGLKKDEPYYDSLYGIKP